MEGVRLERSRAKLPIAAFPSSAELVAEPLGVSLEPIIGEIAAGNVMVLKPSDLALACSFVLAKTIPNYLDSKTIKVIEGDYSVADKLLQRKWDKIFFTGLPKGSMTPRSNPLDAPAVPNPVLDLEASVFHISEAPKKKSTKSKSSKPSKSLPISKKRKISSEAKGSSRAQDSGISPNDIWLNQFFLNEVPTPTPAPLIVESSMIEDDDEAIDEKILAKKTKTSTSIPPPLSQPAKTFEKEDFDLFFEEAGTSAARAEQAHILGFSHMVIPHKMTKSSKTKRNHTSSRSKLVNIFLAPSADPRKMRSAIISFSEDTNIMSRPVRVGNYMRPLISASDRVKMHNISWQCLFNEGMHASNRQQVGDLSTIQAELVQVKGNYLHVMNDLELVTEENKIFEKENEKILVRCRSPHSAARGTRRGSTLLGSAS
ncbi:hypothetical protein RND71_040572 [Anisodus tanguticus]|uniref:Aldehyde dehydrogenase domain-containing protein n=1 Tax=Anisodus tanguticus TaxID=243964 RepID=A0AAE1QSV5_9SOLA|nr:hypothetical protein RND71_040572 [Anisodus tanguticus]